MKEGRDFAVINHINCHYTDLIDDLDKIKSFEMFIAAKETRRAILFDFLQIGESVNQLSKRFLTAFNNKNAERLISIRNRIVHGYSTIRDDIIYNTLKNDLPAFIDELNAFARQYYLDVAKSLIGKEVNVFIDRPIGYRYESIVYQVNYGYIEKLTALDGEFQDAYVIGTNEQLKETRGRVIAIVHRLKDVEDKLIVSVNDKMKISKEEIDDLLFFQEQFFNHEIIM